MKNKKFGFKNIISISKIIIPILAVFLKLKYPDVEKGWFFIYFILLVSLFRLIETFYEGKSQELDKKETYDVWFKLLVCSYIATILLMTAEFFLRNRIFVFPFVAIGLSFYLSAVILRLWGIKTLGQGWQFSSAIGEIIKHKGPYKYIRHPLYLGLMIEVLAITVIPSTYYAFFFALFVVVPIILIKTYFEEKRLIKLFGDEYEKFIFQRPAFIPFKFR
ncbi:MAG: isoprenylcysteine carboxylmethyltransferase family protein [Candidatus Omnitrophica bacterium]|nr:isoprenylcysteine carboxylmethyltransferase family protein [Candidatus Omnitrophota bacterium]